MEARRLAHMQENVLGKQKIRPVYQEFSKFLSSTPLNEVVVDTLGLEDRSKSNFSTESQDFVSNKGLALAPSIYVESKTWDAKTLIVSSGTPSIQDRCEFSVKPKNTLLSFLTLVVKIDRCKDGNWILDNGGVQFIMQKFFTSQYIPSSITSVNTTPANELQLAGTNGSINYLSRRNRPKLLLHGLFSRGEEDFLIGLYLLILSYKKSGTNMVLGKVNLYVSGRILLSKQKKEAIDKFFQNFNIFILA